jgi:hypothetical protein
MCSFLEWQLNVDPTKTLVQQPDGTRDVLLPRVAAQRRSHENSHPATRWNERCAPSWSGSSTPIPQLCAILALAYGNQIEWEMCSYLEWQLNPDPTTLRNSPTRVRQPDRTCHRQATVSRRFQFRFCVLTPVQLVPLRTYRLKRLSRSIT